MHPSALDKARVFRSAYLHDREDGPLDILDVGSAVVDPTQASHRDAMENPRWRITGLDIEAGPNVDLVVADPYAWREVATGSVDVVLCSEVFEHAEYFWITILEIARVLRPNGLAFITSPGSGPLHRFPVDCWRFYDDGLPAAARWAELAVLEAQVQWAPAYLKGLQWRDATCILQKPAGAASARAETRSRLARALLDRELPAEAGGLVPAGDRPSAIGLRVGVGALAAREAALLAEASVPHRKWRLVLRHLREIGRIIRCRLPDLRV